MDLEENKRNGKNRTGNQGRTDRAARSTSDKKRQVKKLMILDKQGKTARDRQNRKEMTEQTG